MMSSEQENQGTGPRNTFRRQRGLAETCRMSKGYPDNRGWRCAVEGGLGRGNSTCKGPEMRKSMAF